MKVNESELPVFARNLRRLRKKRGLSQYDLADLTGISRRMITHYETHAVQPPMDNIETIARVLKVKVSELVDPGKQREEDNDLEISQFDSRSLRKLKEILSLPPNDRNDLYRMLNRMLRENNAKNKSTTHVAEKSSSYAAPDA